VWKQAGLEYAKHGTKGEGYQVAPRAVEDSLVTAPNINVASLGSSSDCEESREIR
jgi:hypothetical protein